MVSYMQSSEPHNLHQIQMLSCQESWAVGMFENIFAFQWRRTAAMCYGRERFKEGRWFPKARCIMHYVTLLSDHVPSGGFGAGSIGLLAIKPMLRCLSMDSGVQRWCRYMTMSLCVSSTTSAWMLCCFVNCEPEMVWTWGGCSRDSRTQWKGAESSLREVYHSFA
jgi:hypothetical protein